jgi:hypothetical protein
MAQLPDVNPEYVAQAAPSCPKNTAVTAYQTLALPQLATVFLWAWNCRIPPGHAGYTGIALIDSGSFVLPNAAAGSAWLIGDDDDLTFTYQQQTGNNVQLAYYNTSTDYPHGWQCRFIYTPMSALSTEGDVIITPSPADWPQVIEQTTGGN